MTKNILSLVALTAIALTSHVQAQSIFQSNSFAQPQNFTQPTYTPNTTMNCSTGQCYGRQCPINQYSAPAYPQAFQNQTYYRGVSSPYVTQAAGFPQFTQGLVLPGTSQYIASQSGNLSTASPTYRSRYSSSGYDQQGIRPCPHPGCTGHNAEEWNNFRASIRSQFSSQPNANHLQSPLNLQTQYQPAITTPNWNVNPNQNLQIQLQQPLQSNPSLGSPFFN